MVTPEQDAFPRPVTANEALQALERGEVRFHFGRLSALITRVAGASGITFGRHVFLDPRAVDSATATIPTWLAVHEAVHVVQYRRAGFWLFLLRYLRDWVAGLHSHGSLRASARAAAYRSIPCEVEARAAEPGCTGRFEIRAQRRRPQEVGE